MRAAQILIPILLVLAQASWDFWQTRPPQTSFWIACDPPTATISARVLTSRNGEETVPAGRAYGPLQLPSKGRMGLTVSAPGYQSMAVMKQDFGPGRYPPNGALSLHPNWFWVPWLMKPGYSLGFLLGLGLVTTETRRRLQQRRLQASFQEGKALPGQEIGPYIVDGTLGRGGMATVYEAHLEEDRRERRALKLMHAPGGGERFLREARISLKLRHPNLVAFYDYGEHQGRAYLVMEKVEGQTLDRAGLGMASRLHCLSQVCQALQVLHDQGIVHRDLKPSNIMVQGKKALLMDFGIARSLDEQDLTLPGQAVGTPGYMAPEQILGEPLDYRADLYALGVVLYECSSGRLPHQAETSFEMITKQVEQPPEPLVGPPAEFCSLVMSLLSRDRAERPGTAGQLAVQLERWAETF